VVLPLEIYRHHWNEPMNTLEHSTLDLHLHRTFHMTQVVQLLVPDHSSLSHHHPVHLRGLDKVQVVVLLQ
jgi:hypothetical protein